MPRSPLRRSRTLAFLIPWILLPLGSCSLLIHEPRPIPTVVHRTVTPGDRLRVRDPDTPEVPPTVLTVGVGGEVEFPHLGTSLSLVGCTAEDVEAILASFSDRPGQRLAVEILPPPGRLARAQGETGAKRTTE